MPDVVCDEGVVAPAQDRKALEALVVDNEDLEQLEALLDQFNIFEAIGAVRQELRHSAMLAFLLDPRQNHGLGDIFFKRLLQRVLISAAEGRTAAPITAIDLDIGDFTEMMVLREWHNIDVLVLAESHHVAIIIENKIDTNEHSDQLRRYYHAVKQHYPGWRIVGLYLTPGGLEPSDPRYYATDYVMIAALVESLAATRASTLGADIHVLM